MTKTQQTPCPLPLALGLETTKEQAQIIAADGSHLAYVECDPAVEIAMFIINACNAHNELIETVKTLLLPHMGDCRLEDERKARALVARITGKPQIGATVREEDRDFEANGEIMAYYDLSDEQFDSLTQEIITKLRAAM